MPGFISDAPLARELIHIGDKAIVREDHAKLRAYFAEDYLFHGPGGDLSFDELRAYFASLRAAFRGPRIVREQIIVDGNFAAAPNTFSGDFTGVFTYSPIGRVEPTGQHLEWEVINTFRYHDNGRLAEEWVQTDYRGFLTKLGVTTAPALANAIAALTGARIRSLPLNRSTRVYRERKAKAMPDVNITPSENGPYLVSGLVHLTAPDGREIPNPDPIALCRCGHSGNKPFCDGTHLTIDFDGTLKN